VSASVRMGCHRVVGVRDAGAVDEGVPLAAIALDDLVTALDDHGDWTSWYLDPATDRTVLSTDDGVVDDEYTEDDLDDLIAIDPSPSRPAYDAMVEFADAVADPQARRELLRSLEGKGAFRRFRRALDDWPDLGLRWREVDRVGSELRALGWLRDHEVVRTDEFEAAVADRRRRLEEILAALAGTGPARFESRDVPRRWDEIARHVDSGGVVITRDGAAWCTITAIGPTD
jgi:hypothetical protein